MKKLNNYFILYFFIFFNCQPAFSIDYDFPSSFCPVGSGARATGMCAYIAISDDSTAPSWNPGAFSQQEEPFEASIVLASFYRTENNTMGKNPAGNKKHHVSDVNVNYFSMVSSFEMFDKNMSVALSYQHLYDMNRSWSFPYIKTSSTLHREQQWDYEQTGQLSALGLSYCMEILRPQLSIGFTLNFWDNDLTPNHWKQQYDMNGKGLLYNTRSFTEDYVKTEDYDFKGFNMNFGVLWTVNHQLTFGAVLKTPFNADIEHEISGKRIVSYPERDDIFVENETYHEQLKMPLSYGFGMVYKFSDIFYLSADLYRTHWNQYIYTDQEGNRQSPVSKTPLSESHVNPTNQVRLGVEYMMLDKNTQSAIPLRAGIFYDPAPAEKNPDDFYGFSLGTGYVKNNICSLDISYVYRMGNDVSSSLIKDEDFSQDMREHMVYVSSIIYFF